MPTFAAPDGTLLAYHVTGEGDPVVCLPGGPMQDASYLPNAHVVVQPRAGHLPWLDDPSAFVAATAAFLG